MKPRILIIGHSHSFSVRHACLAAVKEGRVEEFLHMPLHETVYQPFFQEDGVTLNQRIQTEIKEWFSQSPDPSQDITIISINGNEHNIIGLVCNPFPFDFVLPGDEDTSVIAECSLIPYQAIYRHLESKLYAPPDPKMPAFRLAGELAKLLPSAPIWIEPPPPIGDIEHILAKPGGFAELLAKKGVGPRSVARKLWRLQTEIIQKWCREHAWHYVHTPARCNTADGFLSPQATREDPTHGNPWYGACYLEDILTYIERGSL